MRKGLDTSVTQPDGSRPASAAEPPPGGLEDLLDRLADAKQEDGEVRIGALIQTVGRRSFGPVLLLAGLIAVSPLSGIPGMPTTVAVLVVAVAGQFLFGRRHFWLPQWVQRRHVSHDKFCKALGWVKRPARFVDRFLKPRLEIVTHAGGVHAIAILCIVIAATMPPLEIVPFAATAVGAALTLFGLSLIAQDGVVALIALLLTGSLVGFVIYGVL